MSLLADVAYADPFPENRRLVLSRLIEYPEAGSLQVLERATTDPDETVRRKAIEALTRRSGPEAIRTLSRVADGNVKPRVGAEFPPDYTCGAGKPLQIPSMEREEYPDTDRQAAAKALEGIFPGPQAGEH